MQGIDPGVEIAEAAIVVNHVVCVRQTRLTIGLCGKDPLDLFGIELVAGGDALSLQVLRDIDQ